MGRFVVRRIALSIVALIGVLIVTFAVMHLAPVNPARQYAGSRATAEELARASQLLGLDRSLPVQIVTYAKNFFTGNWGVSVVTKHSVLKDIASTLPYTVELIFFAMLLTMGIGIPLGVVSAHRKDRLPDHMSRILAVGLISIPTFWLALGLQYLLSGSLHLLPLSGQGSLEVLMTDPIRRVTGFPALDALLTLNFDALWDHLLHMVMPVLALIGLNIGSMQRLTRASMLDVLSEDYVTAARSYGLPERFVLWRHGMKNCVGPLATICALCIAWLLVNTYIVESIFAWPGMGNYIVTAVSTLDYPGILAVTLVSAVAYLVLNTVADLVIAIDPRVRSGLGK